MQNAYYPRTLTRFFTMERLFYALQLLTLGDKKYRQLDSLLNTREWIMSKDV